MIHPQAVVSPQAILGDDVEIGAGAVIEAEARIGSQSRLAPLSYVGPGVTLGERCELGAGSVVLAGTCLADDVVVEAGAVLGSCGFGFVQHQGEHVPIPQVGGLQVGAGSRVHAGATIDRGTLHPTRLGAEVTIGAMCQVAHNCAIGDRTVLETQAALAGSCTVGSDCRLEFRSGMAGHAELGDHSRLGIGAGSTRKSPAHSDLEGFPARPRKSVQKLQAALSRLPWALEQMGGSE